MDDLLTTIKTAAETITKSLAEKVNDQVIKDSAENGISLLALKNHAMLSYLQNIALLVSARILNDNSMFDKALENIIIQRVTLEKGIKGLESKISYQLEKVIRAHLKEEQRKEQEKAKKLEKKQAERELRLARELNGEDDESEDEDSSDDDDALKYKPNPMGLSAATGGAEEAAAKAAIANRSAKYQAPKLAPVVPFSEKKESRDRRQRNTAVEEYIRDTANAPIAEPSIGSTIMDHGRGGERTEKDRRKLKEVQQYEEENFTRLPGLSKNQERRAQRKRQADALTKSFFGEDWTFLDRNGSKSSKGGPPKKKQRRK